MKKVIQYDLDIKYDPERGVIDLKTYDLDDPKEIVYQIRESIFNLLFTYKGLRLYNTEYGSEFTRMVFETESEQYKQDLLLLKDEIFKLINKNYSDYIINYTFNVNTSINEVGIKQRILSLSLLVKGVTDIITINIIKNYK